MLSLHSLRAGYGELEVLSGVTLNVQPQEIVALIGPNGTGKSTVLKAIFALATVTAGDIVFQGKNITTLKTHQLLQRGLSYVPQGKINFMDLTVQENLELGGEVVKDKLARTQKVKDKEFGQKRLQRVFSLFPILKEKSSAFAFSLSGGQQQMLAVGRALMQNSQLLLLDEPSLGLSPKLQLELFAKLVELRDQEGLSLLIVEQNARKAIDIADRTYLLEQGEVVLTGGKDILKHKKIKEVYLGGRY